MTYKKTVFFIILMVWASFTTFAQQNNSIAQRRRAIDEALTTLEDYIVMATIHDDETYYNFIELFENETTPVYNDLLGYSEDDVIPANQYARQMAHRFKNKKVVVSNIKNEGATLTDGKWQVRLSLDKQVSYVDSCGIYLSSFEFYDNHDYHLTATLSFDPSNESCKISSITGTIDSNKRLGNRYFALQRTSNRDQDLRYKGESLRFNSYDQALLEGEPNLQTLRKNFSYSNSDMELHPKVDDCQVTMRYKMRRMHLRPYFAFGLGNAFSLDGDDIFSESKSTGTSFGLDFGISVLSRRRFSLGVFTGLGFSMSSMSLLYENDDYYFNYSADVDGDNYVRHYHNLTLGQKIKFSDLNIPLYLDFNVKLVRSLSLYIDLGARFDANVSHNISDMEGSAYVYGIYPQYDNLRLDEHWSFNGFGSHQYGSADLLSSDHLDVNSFTVCGMGGFGLRYSFPNIPLSIEAGMNIIMGLTNFIETANVVALDNSNPIIYNTVSGIESTEHVRNLTEMLDNVKRQQIKISLGLIYKF